MKIAVATPEQVEDGWVTYPDRLFVLPSEIRRGLREMIVAEEARLDADPEGLETRIVTMNRTVLDEVVCAGWSKNAGPGSITYEDVYLWKDGRLVPLLDAHDEAWLSHSFLGDIFDREML